MLSPSPNSSTILASLRQGILDEQAMGGPSQIWIDCGRDYDPFAFHAQTKQQRLGKRRVDVDETECQGLLAMLGIEAHFSLAYNPNGKPKMERFFRTLHDQFDRSWESYAGRSPDTKPETLKAVLADPKRAPTFGEVSEEFDRYLAASNARTDHQIADLCDPRGMVPLSPADALAQWCPTRRVLADPAALDLLMQHWHKPVQVHRQGITIKPLGQPLRYGGMSEALRPYKGLRGDKRPWLRVTYDPADLSSIRVYDERFRYSCSAGLNDLGGLHDGSKISQERVKALIKRKREYKRALQTVRDGQELEYLTAAEVLSLSQPDPATAPKPRQSSIDQMLTVVQTPLDGAARDVQRDELRKAAGAEHDATPAGGGGGQRRGYDRIFARLQDFADVYPEKAPAERPDPWARFHAADEARAQSPSDFFKDEEGGTP